MAKKRAIKAAVKSTAGAKRHSPAMYPEPAPIELAKPLKIVPVDLKSGTWRIDGPTPPEMLAIEEVERQRLDLKGRLATYCENCLVRMEPYWGKRPEHVPRSQWLAKKLDMKVPENAAGDIGDTLLSLKTMQGLLEYLEASGPISPNIRMALCLAIDLGQLLQRGQTQREYGETVDKGRRYRKSTSGATEANSLGKKDRSEAAFAEFTRRMATVKETRRKTDTLRRMSEVVGDDGTTPKWGSLATLKRWSKHWKGITPSE